jgi:hypothetical protein
MALLGGFLNSSTIGEAGFIKGSDNNDMIDKSEEALLNKVSSSPDNEKNNWQS